MKTLVPCFAVCAVLGLTIMTLAAQDAPAPAANATLTRLEERNFGTLTDGTAVKQFILHNAKGMTVKVITYGGIISDVEAPDRNGVMTNLLLGADTLASYAGGRGGISGAIMLGRVANRIAGAQFAIDGAEYKVTANLGTNT